MPARHRGMSGDSGSVLRITEHHIMEYYAAKTRKRCIKVLKSPYVKTTTTRK